MNEFDSSKRRDFDLLLVLSALKRCREEDGTVFIEEYLNAYQELCRFFRLTGRLFGFVAQDLESKMDVIRLRRTGEDKEYYDTVQAMLSYEVTKGITKVKGRLPSGSRTFLRLHRALEFILEFMSRISKSKDHDKVSTIAAEVYAQTLSKHHPWITQKMAALAMYFLPSRKQLIETMCKQDYDTVLKVLERVVEVGRSVYISTHQVYTEYDLLALP